MTATDDRTPPLNPHTALIYTMIIASVADRAMADDELRTIGEVIRGLPAFEEFDETRLPAVASQCVEILSLADGLATLLEMIALSLPARLRETAYALACDIAAADGAIDEEERRLLDALCEGLAIERLVADAVERTTKARRARV